MKGYKLWELVLKKIVYSQYWVFPKVKGTSKFEETQMEKEPEKLLFELRNEQHV
jgi:hypothetical protein